MTKYRKLPVIIEAEQWFKNGDHSQDESEPIRSPIDPTKTFLSEGKIVRRYRNPDCDGRRRCSKCNELMYKHGWIDTLEGSHVVCPGDWIITQKDYPVNTYPCKPDIFELTYEKVV
jgi:hypothetical protein